MQRSIVKYYLLNCFLLLIPIMVWNIAFAGKLPKPFQPQIFWNDIPSWMAIGENTSRMLVFALALFMPLSVTTSIQRIGIIMYVVGVLLYFASWLMLMYAHGWWSNSIYGFIAPAYTPILWLFGIGLIGDRLYFNGLYRRWMFMAAVAIFLLLHNAHTFIIYSRIN